MLLGGGLALAEALQPSGYSPVRDTISSLAARGATDRWVMTSALAGLGVCHVITAVGLRPVRLSGRATLAVGGFATVMVAAFPQPASGNSVAHTVAATIAFIALGAWPAFAAQLRSTAPLLDAFELSSGVSGSSRARGLVRVRSPRCRARASRTRRGWRSIPVATGGRLHDAAERIDRPLSHR